MTNAVAVIRTLSALGDPSRPVIFERIAAKPSAVSEIAAGMIVGRPAVLQHQRMLKEAALASETPDGPKRIHPLDPRGIAAVRDWLDDLWRRSLESFVAFAD